MSCEDCLSRRDFLARTTIALAGAAALAACGDGEIGGSGAIAGPTGSLTVKLSDFPALATVGQIALVSSSYAAVRTGTSSFIAFSRTCTHEGTQIGLASSTTFQCPNHLARFSNDGSVLQRPTTGESISPLKRVNATVDATAGTLTIG